MQSSMTILCAGAPSPPSNIISMAASASSIGRSNDYAFAGNKAIGLQHDRRGLLLRTSSFAGSARLKRSAGGGRNIVAPLATDPW